MKVNVQNSWLIPNFTQGRMQYLSVWLHVYDFMKVFGIYELDSLIAAQEM